MGHSFSYKSSQHSSYISRIILGTAPGSNMRQIAHSPVREGGRMESLRFGHAERKSLFMARPTNSIPGATHITGSLLVKRVNERAGEQLSSCSFCEPGNEPGHPRDTRTVAARGEISVFRGRCWACAQSDFLLIHRWQPPLHQSSPN